MKVTVSKKVIEFIFNEETGSREYYNKFVSRPIWAKGASGITIAGGYDLGYHTKAQIEKDWKGLIPDNMIKLLQSVAGLKGQRAANALTPNIRNGVQIPYDIAYQQYIQRVIKEQVKKTVKAFPSSDKLNPDTLGVLVSIVYNRGTDMTDNDVKAQDRREMRVIRQLVPNNDITGIATQIRSMKRLWDGVPDYVGDVEQRFGGLIIRRDKEADLVIQSIRAYKPEELIVFDI